MRPTNLWLTASINDENAHHADGIQQQRSSFITHTSMCRNRTPNGLQRFHSLLQTPWQNHPSQNVISTPWQSAPHHISDSLAVHLHQGEPQVETTLDGVEHPVACLSDDRCVMTLMALSLLAGWRLIRGSDRHLSPRKIHNDAIEAMTTSFEVYAIIS